MKPHRFIFHRRLVAIGAFRRDFKNLFGTTFG